ncbi:MAG TPA: hypothetical protein VGU68_09810 [Ktedonobacteraceae bacterium]|nr:hypothetical protein [Ktedonobacteraceae bacterium]
MLTTTKGIYLVGMGLAPIRLGKRDQATEYSVLEEMEASSIPTN